MLWVLFAILLTLWLLALIAGGFGALIHSVIALSKSEAEAVALPVSEAIHGPEFHG